MLYRSDVNLSSIPAPGERSVIAMWMANPVPDWYSADQWVTAAIVRRLGFPADVGEAMRLPHSGRSGFGIDIPCSIEITFAAIAAVFLFA